MTNLSNETIGQASGPASSPTGGPANDLDRILPWYSGKALEIVRDRILPILREASLIGCWPRGVSRGVRAGLGKQSIAARWGSEHESCLRSIRAPSGTDGRREDGFYLSHAMQFGSIHLAQRNLELAARLRPYAGAPIATDDPLGDEVARDRVALLDEAARWAADFAPVARLIELLDSRRPKPTIVAGTLSPIVLRNVGIAIGIDLTSIRCPEVSYEWKEIGITIKGKWTIVRVCEGKILWPEGTRHGLSRWSTGSQCHACGHRISNPFNWVPLVAAAVHPIEGPGPASLWVGRDCAKKLFACDVSGDAMYAEQALARNT